MDGCSAFTYGWAHGFLDTDERAASYKRLTKRNFLLQYNLARMWRNGIRNGLKIRREKSLRVQIPPFAPNKNRPNRGGFCLVIKLKGFEAAAEGRDL